MVRRRIKSEIEEGKKKHLPPSSSLSLVFLLTKMAFEEEISPSLTYCPPYCGRI
jgi:hypothetical protein